MLTNNIGIVGIFLLGGFGFALFSIFLGWLLSPHKPSLQKAATYECGVESEGSAWVQFKINYFLYGLIFVVFDVETIFLYPLAVAYNQLSVYAFFEIVLFIGILVLGLWYVWREGALEWI